MVGLKYVPGAYLCTVGAVGAEGRVDVYSWHLVMVFNGVGFYKAWEEMIKSMCCFLVMIV